jgi:hypothetical protein
MAEESLVDLHCRECDPERIHDLRIRLQMHTSLMVLGTHDVQSSSSGQPDGGTLPSKTCEEEYAYAKCSGCIDRFCICYASSIYYERCGYEESSEMGYVGGYHHG